MTPYETFWYWINERHAIYLRRQKGLKKPWTKDPILQSYRFCNVFRELDKTTVWIREVWRKPYANHKHLFFMMAVARQLNHLPMLTGIIRPYDFEHVRERMSNAAFLGYQVYGGAYIITAGGRSGPKWKYTADQVLKPLYRNPPPFVNVGEPVSIRQMWEQLREYQGFGPFLAYEVATDLRWTRYYDGSDHMSWANPGPGAKRGIRRIFGNGVDDKRKFDYDGLMWDLLRRSVKAGNLSSHVPPLEMRDIEHSLCEVDKYLRVREGEGRPKAKYDGGPQ